MILWDLDLSKNEIRDLFASIPVFVLKNEEKEIILTPITGNFE